MRSGLHLRKARFNVRTVFFEHPPRVRERGRQVGLILRVQQTIHSLEAYLTTILTRLCLNQLQSAQRKREVYVGPWLPEPILTAETAETGDPEKRVELEESISLAFLVLLEQLQPFERAVFLLREVFAYEFAEIATMLDKSEAACRRSFSRAKHHLRAQRPRFPASRETHR